MIIFMELVEYAKNLGGKSLKNLFEHHIIKMIRKFDKIFLHEYKVTMNDHMRPKCTKNSYKQFRGLFSSRNITLLDISAKIFYYI